MAKVLVEVETEDEFEDTGVASDSVGATRAWATVLHGTQKDKSGQPYLTHLDAVARNVYAITGAFDWELLQVAYLHDAMEDAGVTERTLLDQGYSDRVIDGVFGMTKLKGEPNPKYVGRVIDAGQDVQVVKLADLYHNTQADRLATLTPAVQDRLRKKYLPAIWRIERELLATGYLQPSEATVTFEQALAVVRVESKPVAPIWRRKEGTDFSGVYEGDFVRFKDGGAEYKVHQKRISSKGNMVVRTSPYVQDHTEVVFVKGAPFWHRWGTSAAYTSTTWKDYLGLPKDWQEGDEVE